VTTEPSKGMTQTAPYPHKLQELVRSCTYRPDWTVKMMTIVRDPADTHGAEGAGLTLIITTSGYDSYHPERGQNYRVNHYFIVPAATFNRKSWMRWLFDCFVDVETHETMEFFTIDGRSPLRHFTDRARTPMSCTSMQTAHRRLPDSTRRLSRTDLALQVESKLLPSRFSCPSPRSQQLGRERVGPGQGKLSSTTWRCDA
jgi:hypothetical protein